MQTHPLLGKAVFRLSLIAITLALLTTPAIRAIDVQGTFVAHVVTIEDGAGAPSYFFLETPSATISQLAPASPYFDKPVSYNIAISAPSETPRGQLVGGDTLDDPASAADFSVYDGEVVSQVTLTAPFVMSEITESDTPDWEDPRVFKAVRAFVTEDGGYTLRTDRVFPREGGSETVGGDGGDHTGRTRNRTGSTAADLLVDGPSNPKLRTVSENQLDISVYIQKWEGGDLIHSYSVASFTLTIHTIYEMRVIDPEPDPDDYVELTAFDGGVTVNKGSGWFDAYVGVKLGTGDQLITDPLSTASLRFVDGSILRISELSHIATGPLIRQGNAYKAAMLLKIGEVSAEINPDKVANSDFGVATPVATASVRGTVFTVRHVLLPEPRTTVVVTEGRVAVAPQTVDPDSPTWYEDLDTDAPSGLLSAFQRMQVTGSATERDSLAAPRLALGAVKRFRPTRIRQRGPAQTIPVIHRGGGPFDIVRLTATISGRAGRDFQILRQPASRLSDGQSTSVQVGFRPKAKGARRALLLVRGNVSAQATLLGTGKKK